MKTDYVYLRLTSPEEFFKRAKESPDYHPEFGMVHLSFFNGRDSRDIIRLSKQLASEHLILICDVTFSEDIRGMKTPEQLHQLYDETLKKIEEQAKKTVGEAKFVDGQFGLEDD